MVLLQWTLSLMSMIMIYQMGNKWKYAPLLGIFNQVLWIVYVLSTKQFGLMLGVIGYTVIHIINTYKWLGGKNDYLYNTW